MKNIAKLGIMLAAFAMSQIGQTMADVGPYRETVGIRQVTSDGTKLPAAMRMDVTGGFVSTETASDGVVQYKLDLAALQAAIVGVQASIDAVASKQIVAVEAFGQTNINADPNTITIVNFDDSIGPSDITVNLPTPTPELANAQIRVVDISADGGLAAGQALKLAGTFAPAVGGGYATSPYVVGDNGFGQSRRGAWIDVVCLGADGWRISAEGVQPKAP